MISRVPILLIFGFLAACGSDDEPGPSGGAGPCVIAYSEPVLTFQSAVGRPSGAAIPQITLTDVKFNGEPRDPLVYWGATPQDSFNVSISEDGVHCTIPC